MATEPHTQLTTKDHAILQTMLERHRGPHGPFAQLLEQKVRSSAICFRDDIPPDVVTLNTRLMHSINGVIAGPRLIVQSEVSDLPEYALSIHTLRGLALLGLTEGGSITVEPEFEIVEELRIEKILSQPEAEARMRQAAEGRGNDASVENIVRFLAKPGRKFSASSPDDDDPGPRAA